MDFFVDADDRYDQVKIIGIGDSAANAVNKMVKNVSNHVKHIYVNYNLLKLNSDAEHQVLWEDHDKSHSQLVKLLQDSQVIFLIADLSVETDIHTMAEITRLNQDNKCIKIGIVILPMDCDEKGMTAAKRINKLQECLNMLILIHQESIVFSGDPNETMQTLQDISDDKICKCVSDFVDIIHGHNESGFGLLNVCLKDIRPMLLDAGRAYIGIGEGRGQNSFEEAALIAINSLHSNSPLMNAKAVLIVFISSDCSLSQVSEVTENIMKTCPNSDLVFNVFIDEKFEDKSTVSIFTTGLYNQNNANTDKEKTLKQDIKNLSVSHSSYIEIPDFLKPKKER